MKLRASVITCSDRAAADIAEDRSGPILREALAELGFSLTPAVIVPNEEDQILAAARDALRQGARVVITAGGSSIATRDITVEVTRRLIAYEVPGLMEEVRRRGAEKEPRALLSRGIAGVIAPEGAPRTLIVNAPGSRGGARDTLAVVGPLLRHIVEQLDGKDHERT